MHEGSPWGNGFAFYPFDTRGNMEHVCWGKRAIKKQLALIYMREVYAVIFNNNRIFIHFHLYSFDNDWADFSIGKHIKPI